MDTAVADVARWRFSTDALPERERSAALDAVYGRNTVVAYEALPDAPVYAGFTQRRLPGLVLLTGALEAGRVEPTRRHLADGGLDLCLPLNLGGRRPTGWPQARPGGHLAPRRGGPQSPP